MVLSFHRLFQSFRDALRGIVYTFKTEQNFRIQIAASIIVLVLSFLFSLRGWERILIFLMIFFVLIVELLNTAVEKFSDLLIPRMHQQISVIKDVMAAAVLITSTGAAFVGISIFWPHLVNWLQ